MNTIEEIANVIKTLKSAVIFTHSRPDGDTLGSSMALSRALSMLGIKNIIVNDCEIPAAYLFLPLAREIKQTVDLDAEAYICVDSSDENRFGELQKTFLKGAAQGKITINIDHHISNTRYCRYNFVRERASNCENMAELIRALGVTPDKELGDYLMMGMVTDSGRFSHSDVNGDTFREAAYAADAGADVKQITYEMFGKQTKNRAALYASVISKIRFLLNDKLAIVLVTQELLKKYGCKTDATEGIVDFALTVDVVEVSTCLLEVKKGQYKVSLRSKGKVNVNQVARAFGGGGHVLASGCMLFGEYEEVCDRLRYAVLQNMEEA